MTMSQNKLHVRTGDTVEVLSGIYKGGRGRVIDADPENRKVTVEGVNTKYKHVRRTQDNPQGGRMEIECPIDASNVQPICTNRECQKYDEPVRTGKKVLEDGSKVRTCKKCGEEISTPE